MDLERFRDQAKNKSAENKKFLQSLKKKDPRKVDDAFHTVHEEVFEEMDCLTCANCCKTTSRHELLGLLLRRNTMRPPLQ